MREVGAAGHAWYQQQQQQAQHRNSRNGRNGSPHSLLVDQRHALGATGKGAVRRQEAHCGSRGVGARRCAGGQGGEAHRTENPHNMGGSPCSQPAASDGPMQLPCHASGSMRTRPCAPDFHTVALPHLCSTADTTCRTAQSRSPEPIRPAVGTGVSRSGGTGTRFAYCTQVPPSSSPPISHACQACRGNKAGGTGEHSNRRHLEQMWQLPHKLGGRAGGNSTSGDQW